MGVDVWGRYSQAATETCTRGHFLCESPALCSRHGRLFKLSLLGEQSAGDAKNKLPDNVRQLLQQLLVALSTCVFPAKSTADSVILPKK